MSTNIAINAAQFDGATLVSLDSPDSLSERGAHQYTFPAVGWLDLETVPNISPSTPIWVQVATVRQSTNPAAIFTLQVFNRSLSRVQPLFTDEADPVANAWNVLLPQSVWLAIDAEDGAAGPEGGVLAISFWQFGAREWPYLQCCHRFGPYETLA